MLGKLSCFDCYMWCVTTDVIHVDTIAEGEYVTCKQGGLPESCPCRADSLPMAGRQLDSAQDAVRPDA